jgi:PAS domain S-box-containing protein
VFVEEALRWLPGSDDGAAPAEPQRQSTINASAPRPGGHILLADDNADMRSYVKRLLVAEGFAVEAVADGEAALVAARRQAPDLVLSDVMPPRLDGFGLLRALRGDPDLRDIPFVLLSARAGEEARVEGLDAGADDYLTKPFAARELVARVSTNLHLARERREASLRESEARLRALNADLERQVIERSRERGRTWHFSPDLLSIINLADGIFERTNPAWEAALGWSADELEGTPYFCFVHTDDLAASKAAFEEARRGHPVLRFENRYRAKDGRCRWLSWVAVPESGKLYSGARDITEDKVREAQLAQAQEALRQAQKMEAIGQLTGGVAHDFNNLLMVLSGGLELLDRQTDPARRQRLMDGMRQATQRGAALTCQLLTFSRRQPLRSETVELTRQIGGMRELLNRSLRGDVQARTAFAGHLWPVEVDPGELELVVLNLCVNARDAMPEGGTITVGAENMAGISTGELQGDFVRLYVADTGTGMSPEIVSRVFDPFFTTKDVGKGSGLGLAQVYGFAKQSGGTVRIDSAIGRGTTVSLLLPRSHKAPTVSNPQPIDLNVGTSLPVFAGCVLVVEDDDEVATLVHEMLSQMGFEVTRAASAAAALGALANGRSVDLVLSDIMMPGGMDGLELAREVRRRRPGLPILLTSGYADAAKHQAQQDGIAILPKPYQTATLAAAISQTLGVTPHTISPS